MNDILLYQQKKQQLKDFKLEANRNNDDDLKV